MMTKSRQAAEDMPLLAGVLIIVLYRYYMSLYVIIPFSTFFLYQSAAILVSIEEKKKT